MSFENLLTFEVLVKLCTVHSKCCTTILYSHVTDVSNLEMRAKLHTGNQSWARHNTLDNVTMFSGSKLLDLAFLLFLLWQLQLDPDTLIFVEFFLVPGIQLRYNHVYIYL